MIYFDTSHYFDKIANIRRNKPGAIIVPIDEYERMKESADSLEAMQIAEVIFEYFEKYRIDPYRY